MTAITGFFIHACGGLIKAAISNVVAGGGGAIIGGGGSAMYQEICTFINQIWNAIGYW